MDYARLLYLYLVVGRVQLPLHRVSVARFDGLAEPSEPQRATAPLHRSQARLAANRGLAVCAPCGRGLRWWLGPVCGPDVACPGGAARRSDGVDPRCRHGALVPGAERRTAARKCSCGAAALASGWFGPCPLARSVSRIWMVTEGRPRAACGSCEGLLHVLMTNHSKMPVASNAEHGRVTIVMQQRRTMGIQSKHRTTC